MRRLHRLLADRRRRGQLTRSPRMLMLILLVALPLTQASATARSTPANPASALVSQPVTATSTYSYVPMLDDRKVFGSPTAVAVDYAVFRMAPGEIRRVTDQLEIRSSNTGNDPEVDNELICYDQTGNEIPPLPNPDPPAGATYLPAGGDGTNYISHHNVPYQWNAAMLIQAPPDNPPENYLCFLDARIDPGHQMTVIAPAAGERLYGTWLEVSTADEVGAQEVQSQYCGSTGTETYSECVYVGGPARLGNPAAASVLWNIPGTATPADVWDWTAANGATNIDGVATIQITECDWETPSCPKSERGDSGVTNADGESYLDVDQLNPNGSVCQTHRAYSEETTPDGQTPLNQDDLSEQFAIPMVQHHLPLYYRVSAPVSQNCLGSRRFALQLHIQWTGANDVKIDGGYVNVLNSVRATTITVPNVTGLTVAHAVSALQAADLTAVPTYVHASGLPGTVLEQNSPGGTIEPAGSAVDITVTLGDLRRIRSS